MVVEKKFQIGHELDTASSWDDWTFHLRSLLSRFNMLVHFNAGIGGGPAAIPGGAAVQQIYRDIGAAMRDSCTGAAGGHLRARTAAGINIIGMNPVQLYLELQNAGAFNIQDLDQQTIHAKDVGHFAVLWDFCGCYQVGGFQVGPLIGNVWGLLQFLTRETFLTRVERRSRVS